MVGLIVATAVLLLIQLPATVASVSVAHDPAHTLIVPPIVAGLGITVTILVIKHPVALSVYVTVTVPATMPVTMPVDEPTEAEDGSLLLHEPPGVASFKVVFNPIHTEAVPVIAPGNGFTVNTAVARQPVANV